MHLRLPLLLLALLPLAGCNPVYLLKAGVQQARILAARTPLPEVVLDPATDEALRGQLLLAMEAREFAAETLGLEVGDAYTSYVELSSDTLSLILSAARKDRFEAKSWWFPVVGRMPYKGFFHEADARAEARTLESEGFDTWIRPTAAYSTLGWFSDPILSTMVRGDAVGLVETLFHEIAHRHLYIPGEGRFNESFATWVGNRGAILFFCEREGGGPDTLWCHRARDRWEDAKRFSLFLDRLVADLFSVYDDPSLSFEEILLARERLFAEAIDTFREEVAPGFRASTYAGFLATPLNNATLLSRMLYYHRLPDFDRHLETRGGSLPAAIDAFARFEPGSAESPFSLLPSDPRPPAGPDPAPIVPSLPGR